MKEGIRGFASVSAAFRPAGPIHLGNPGSLDDGLKAQIIADAAALSLQTGQPVKVDDQL